MNLVHLLLIHLLFLGLICHGMIFLHLASSTEYVKKNPEWQIKAEGLLVTPLWDKQNWYQTILRICVKPTLVLKPSKIMLQLKKQSYTCASSCQKTESDGVPYFRENFSETHFIEKINFSTYETTERLHV